MRLVTLLISIVLLFLSACSSPAAPKTATETAAAPASAAAAQVRTPAADGAMCGGFAGIACAANNYCAMETGQCVTVADGAGVCRKKPDVCTEQEDPVCGCDGVTYGNSCMAQVAGTSIATHGACKQ